MNHFWNASLVAVALSLALSGTGCGGGGGGGAGGVTALAAPIGDISGTWIVSAYQQFDCQSGSADGDPQSARVRVFSIVQSGHTVEFLSVDGTPLPNVEDGVITGTLVGDQLEITFTETLEDGRVRTTTGTVTVGPNLHSFRTEPEGSFTWKIFEDADAEFASCSLDQRRDGDFWTGSRVDLAYFDAPGVVVETLGSGSVTIDVDDAVEVLDLKVYTEIDASQAVGLEVTLEKNGQEVILQGADTYTAAARGHLNVIWSEAGRTYGHLTPVRGPVADPEFNLDTGIEMQPSVEDPWSAWIGSLANGTWELTVKDTSGGEVTIQKWGLLVNTTPRPVDIAGEWWIEFDVDSGDCLAKHGHPDRGTRHVRIQQDGSDVVITGADGSPLEGVDGGTITSVLSGRQLTVSFTETDDEGVTTRYHAELEFSDFLVGNRAQSLVNWRGVSVEVRQPGESDPACTGTEVWRGRRVDLPAFEADVMDCLIDTAPGPGLVGGGTSNFHVFIDEEVTIGEVEVLTDFTSGFSRTYRASIEAPDGTEVRLFLPHFATSERVNVHWADRKSRAFGDVPFPDDSGFGGRMESWESLTELEGLSSAGQWSLSLTSFDDVVEHLDAFCVAISEEPPPEPVVLEVCRSDVPLVERSGGVHHLESAVEISSDTRVLDVEVLVDVTHAFDVEPEMDISLSLHTDAGGFVETMLTSGSVFAPGAERASVIWSRSEDARAYNDFPLGEDGEIDTLFGGPMAAVSSMDRFIGEPAHGVWTLHVSSFDTATVNEWCLFVTEDP